MWVAFLTKRQNPEECESSDTDVITSIVYFLILWTLSWMAFDPYEILLNALPGNYLYECEDHQLICFYGGFFLTGLRKIVCMFDGDVLVLTVSV